ALLLEQVSRLCQQSSPSALGVSNLPLLDHDGHIAHVAYLRLLHTTSGNHIMVTAPAPTLVALGELSAPVIPRARQMLVYFMSATLHTKRLLGMFDPRCINTNGRWAPTTLEE